MAGFKARARALDMLGRQQIAGIPTAINELFKNAHDAYADNVIVDYFRSDRLFVLRDDGYGMTRQDFEEKWLTLGTESKVNVDGGPVKDDTLPDFPEKRTIMGEKGIGRLAIASIGDHVLILTRALRKDGLHDLVMAFVYWKMYEIPGVNLDEIVVPIKEIPGGKLPSESDFKELSQQVIDNINSLYKRKLLSSQKQRDELIAPVASLSLVADKINKYIVDATLDGNGHGTQFIISPASELMDSSIDGIYEPDINKARVSPMKEMLLGFCNTMFNTLDSKPVINTSFRDHKTDEYYEDIIKEEEFWTLADYNIADQKIVGEINEYGQFKGNVTVYGKTFENHIINWNQNNGLKTVCGPFRIQLGYIQGNKSDTLLSPQEHTRMILKLDKISGLYIYKDDIRILPYGNSAYDYLKLEESRNKSNAYYFFSYRRMFGAVYISKEHNPSLIEKAGREGFRENMAYKQFIAILQNLFLQLAADFFRDPSKYVAGPNADYFTKQKELLMQKYKAQQKYEKQARAKKEKFEKQLDECFDKIQGKEYVEELKEFFKELEMDVKVCLSKTGKDEAVSAFLDLEQQARNKFYEITDVYHLSLPRGVQCSKLTRKNYELYLGLYDQLNSSEFKTAKNQLEQILNDCQQKLEVNISRRKRLEIAVDTTIEKYQKETRTEVSGIQKTARDISGQIIQLSKEMVIGYENTIRKVQNELNMIDPYSLDDKSLVDNRSRMEEELISSAEQINVRIGNIRRQLDNLVLDSDTSSLDALDMYAEEVDMLKERLNADIELSQLGLAISAIQHEFQHTVLTIRTQIKRFKAWADVNEGLKDIYNQFRVNFEHLDNYLTLFLPLNRRLYRKEVEIFGNDTYNFVKSVFYTRISEERHNINLSCSNEFSKNVVWGYPSTFYPVFINLVDNAIFWLKDQNIAERKIYFDADTLGNMYISNNGPGIDIRDRDRIFESGFSRKPNGRGMGLFISKEVLNKAGFDLTIVDPHTDYNVTFCISKLNEEEKA